MRPFGKDLEPPQRRFPRMAPPPSDRDTDTDRRHQNLRAALGVLFDARIDHGPNRGRRDARHRHWNGEMTDADTGTDDGPPSYSRPARNPSRSSAQPIPAVAMTRSAADAVGIGRGADLLLYTAVLVALVVLLAIYLRFAAVESQITELVRHVAISEVRRSQPNESDSGKE